MPDGLVGGAQALVGLAQEHGTRHVRAVAVGTGPEIEHDALARLEQRGARYGVGARAVRARGHDGGEREAPGTMAAHEVLQLHMDPLGHAGAHERDNVRKRGVGDGLGGAQARDLGRLLDGAQVENEAARLAQDRDGAGSLGERGLEGAELAEREGVLDAEDGW